MARLKRIFINHTTADVETAGTDSAFQLQIVTSGEDILKRFPDLPSPDERERNHTNEYDFPLNVEPDEDEEEEVVDTDDENFRLIIRVLDVEDPWLPSRIWALGETLNGEIMLLGAHPEWEGGWFDRSEGLEEHTISGGPIAS